MLYRNPVDCVPTLSHRLNFLLTQTSGHSFACCFSNSLTINEVTFNSRHLNYSAWTAGIISACRQNSKPIRYDSCGWKPTGVKWMIWSTCSKNYWGFEVEVKVEVEVEKCSLCDSGRSCTLRSKPPSPTRSSPSVPARAGGRATSNLLLSLTSCFQHITLKIQDLASGFTSIPPGSYWGITSYSWKV